MDLSGCPQPNPGSIDECSLGEIAFSSLGSPVSDVPLPGAGVLALTGAAALAASRRGRRA